MTLGPTVLPLEPAHTERFLFLEALASQPYSEFVYGNSQKAQSVSQTLFEHKACEFCAPYGRVLVDEGRPVGMVACLSEAELQKQRLKAAYAINRRKLFDDTEVMKRIQLAALTLAEPDPHDLYLSRIAVEPAARGRGSGSFLLRWVAEEGRARGLARIVLEVSPASPGSEGFYRANGFVELARKAVEDSETKRRLEYVHLGKELKPK